MEQTLDDLVVTVIEGVNNATGITVVRDNHINTMAFYVVRNRFLSFAPDDEVLDSIIEEAKSRYPDFVDEFDSVRRTWADLEAERNESRWFFPEQGAWYRFCCCFMLQVLIPKLVIKLKQLESISQ